MCTRVTVRWDAFFESAEAPVGGFATPAAAAAAAAAAAQATAPTVDPVELDGTAHCRDMYAPGVFEPVGVPDTPSVVWAHSVIAANVASYLLG